MLTPRDYQERAILEVIARIDSAPILVAPTGAGKSFMGVEIVRRLGCTALWVAHRRELIHQAADAVREAGGTCGLMLAGERPSFGAPIQVGSVQTLARRDLPNVDLLVIDEAHHAPASLYRVLVERYARRTGLTATPFRLDGRGLGSAGFGAIVVAAYMDDLCRAGVLHEPVVFASKHPPDLKGLRVVAGDYEQKNLSNRMCDAKLVGNVVETWKLRAAGRRTICFAVGIEHAQALAARWRAEGVPTEVITGETPKVERAGILARVREGVTLVVVNCQVLTEGVDLPALEVASVARPTASLNLHLQMLGRIVRACEAKTGAIVLDHANNWAKHGAVTRRLEYDLHGKVRASQGEMTKACPFCGRVIAMSAKRCPQCGANLVGLGTDRDMMPREAPGELVQVSGGKAREETYVERARAYRGMHAKAHNIVYYGKTRENLTFELPPDESARVDALAASMYRKRYGASPVALGALLFDGRAAPGEPGHINPNVWMRLRELWAAIGKKAGWPDSKTAWYVTHREEEARSGGVIVTAKA